MESARRVGTHRQNERQRSRQILRRKHLGFLIPHDGALRFFDRREQRADGLIVRAFLDRKEFRDRGGVTQITGQPIARLRRMGDDAAARENRERLTQYRR